MAKVRGKPVASPRRLLDDVEWCLCRPGFRSRRRFEAEFQRRYRHMGWEFAWCPDEVVLPCARVRVRPVFWDDYDPAEESRFIAELAADNPSGFTAAELLFKVHNLFLRRWEEDAGDYIYFEGLSLVRKPLGSSPPLYDIDVGS